ncbi:hypothetical protein SFC08_18520, partial [Lysinibacillus halotolerans]
DFLELLIYLKEHNNLEKIIVAVEQLEKNPMVQISTDKIIFLANQCEHIHKTVHSKNEVTTQSLENLSAITALFETKKTGVLH